MCVQVGSWRTSPSQGVLCAQDFGRGSVSEESSSDEALDKGFLHLGGLNQGFFSEVVAGRVLDQEVDESWMTYS